MTGKGASGAKRILGLDYGTRRIGVSVSDPFLTIAQGVGTFIHSAKVIEEIQALVDRYDVGLIVVGIPFHQGGRISEVGLQARAFIDKLRTEVGVDVVEWDERFTSKMAEQTMRFMGAKKRQRQNKAKVDEIASALILQSYLDSRKQ
ncbi:MAG TPA: Holliday junction resolvase RuvX [Bacteroidota bacterium]